VLDPAVTAAVLALRDVGLGYLRLGQPATELSGGEAQRLKVAAELARPSMRPSRSQSSLYLLDEPTTGLHPADADLLTSQLDRLVDNGHTVIAATHAPSLIMAADNVIDLGPDAGGRGGRVLISGPPEDLLRDPASRTGQYLRHRGHLRDRT
jgi:excinuclease ABC subunit A